MKKILSYFTLLLFASATPVMAQVEELKGKAVSVGAAVADFETDTWYFLHQSRTTSDKGTHSEVGQQPQTGGFMYDLGVGEQLKKSTLEAVPDNSSASSKAAYLVRFISSSTQIGAYHIQFGTGNYFTTSTSGVPATTASKYDAEDLNVYKINGTDGNFAINKWNMAGRLDNNGPGYTVVYWGTGETNFLDGNNNWAIHEAVINELDAYDAAMAEASATLVQYNQYASTFEGGTGPGQYDPAAVAAFEAALTELNEIDNQAPGEEFSPEEILRRNQAVLDTYEALIKTKVPYAMDVEEGYYFFTSALTFKESTTTETTIDEETGEEIPGETITTYPIKAMYSYQNGSTFSGAWKTKEAKAPFLWKVTKKGDKVYDIINMGTDARFTQVATSTAVKMSTESDSLMVFDYGMTRNDSTFVNIRLQAQAERNYFYLHAGGHGGGTGKGSDLVGWNFTNGGASEWYMEKVDEATALQMIADYEPIKNSEQRLANTKTILEAAKKEMKIAEDIKTEVSEDKLVTDISQLSSPHSDPTEGNLANLLDGEASVTNMWHSSWQSGNVAGGTHYLQVEIQEADVDAAAMTFTRRPVANDHVTEWGVYGTNEADAEKDACVELAVLSTPFGTNTETLTTEAFKLQGYKYIRFYLNATTTGRGYGHMSEFQLYKASIIVNPTSQMAMMGNVYTDLQAAVDKATEEGDEVSVETFQQLESAYNAFKAMYVDPTELRQTITRASTFAATVKIGNNPGEWKSANSVTKLNHDITAAKNYDQAGQYTKEQSDEYVATIKADSAAILAAANKIETGKWYRFRYATQEEMEANDWSLTPGAEYKTEGQNGQNDTLYYEALYGKYVTLANQIENLVDENGKPLTYQLEAMEKEEAVVGSAVYFDADDDIDDKDLSMFRFVAVGDSAYLLQNKATGMYLKAAGPTGGVTMSIHPTLFNASPLGYGRNLIAAKGLNGENYNYLHAQRLNNVLVTWNAYTVDSNSGLYIEEVEDVDGGYAGDDFQLSVQPGKLYAFCYPVAVTAAKGMYLPEVNGTTVTLKKAEGVLEPGTPFFYQHDGDYDAEEPADAEEIVTLKHGNSVVKTARTINNLVGVFTTQTIGAGKLVATGSTLEVSKRSNTSVAANSAYIQGEYDLEAEITVNLSDDTLTGVAEVIAKAEQEGNIYTLDGKLVGKGNLQTVKALGRGIYVINGVKVAVK